MPPTKERSTRGGGVRLLPSGLSKNYKEKLRKPTETPVAQVVFDLLLESAECGTAWITPEAVAARAAALA
jgi:hypothetical protein